VTSSAFIIFTYIKKAWMTRKVFWPRPMLMLQNSIYTSGVYSLKEVSALELENLLWLHVRFIID